jgi:hypothetical protein
MAGSIASGDYGLMEPWNLWMYLFLALAAVCLCLVWIVPNSRGRGISLKSSG